MERAAPKKEDNKRMRQHDPVQVDYNSMSDDELVDIMIRDHKTFLVSEEMARREKGFTFQEIGDVLGRSLENVRQIHKKALLKMRRIFVKERNV